MKDPINIGNGKSIHVIDDNFRAALEHSPVPIILSAEDGEVIIANEKCMDMIEYDFEEVNTLEKWMKKIHRNREEFNYNFVRDIYKQGVTSQGGEERVYTKTGKELYWAFHNSLIGELQDGRLALLTVCIDLTEKKKAEKKQKELINDLNRTKVYLEASMESQKNFVLILMDPEYKYLYFNDFHREMMKDLYDIDITPGDSVLDNIRNDEDRKKEQEAYGRALNGESFSREDVYGNHEKQYFETHYSPMIDDKGNIIGVSILSQNVTESKKVFKKVQQSERDFRLLYSSMSQGLGIHQIITDEDGKPVDYQVLDFNNSYAELFDMKHEETVGKTIRTLFPQLEQYWIDRFGKVALTGESTYFENYSRSVDKHLQTYSYSLGEGKFAVLISDISERIERDKEIEYLSYNDQLTGVYNRRYYDDKFVELDKKENLPLSLIMGDVNGLKLVNDSFGHQVGDLLLQKVASILKDSCRDTDIITRIGGDEFVIILPKTSHEIALKVIDRINAKAKKERVESIDVSISFGSGTKVNVNQSLIEIFKRIEDDMYRVKLNEGTSMRSKTIDLIMTTLYEKNEREMFHSKRVSSLSEALAFEYGLPKDQVLQAKNAGLMHDIGKIGINERTLNKKGKLLDKEWKEIKRHSEIGYRILSSVNELSEIADHILMHHENIDGTGYPKGLKGEEISLIARIISIADAYDAMTGPRTYRKILSKGEAMEELIRCKGTQFDSKLVDVFVEKVLDK